MKRHTPFVCALLLADPTPNVQTCAAIALYRITGKRVRQFSEGYE